MDFQPTPFQVSTADARASYTERQLGFPTASSSALAAPTDLACSSSNGTTATPATTTDVPANRTNIFTAVATVATVEGGAEEFPRRLNSHDVRRSSESHEGQLPSVNIYICISATMYRGCNPNMVCISGCKVAVHATHHHTF